MNTKKKFQQPVVASDTVADLSAKLLEANKKLQIAERERTLMLENISHDLRAPLTAIRSTVDYMKEKSKDGVLNFPDEERKAMLNLLDARTRTLEALISDLYYMTCIESGREEFNLNKVPLSQFLEEYFFAAELDEKYDNYKLVLEVPEDLDVIVNIDVAKLSRVLDNLFINARKYSDEGSTIALGAGVDGENVFFYVKDNGQGIPKESLPYIFDRTYRVSGARTPSKETSSGLGLSIVKTIVENHGGSVECRSELGKGSTFTVTIPVADRQ
ncbi:sensor histidine kinase [Butyrivibrio sp. MC2021]|uniref:sensor histidine kinase n=1 Tax=Butyrivibrio sp. MC2021 TaxID=1408306 RepID=UPI000561B007|nr:HAMP domain-containing sensor histidine kinase [Butyrivibrio sp. MC2021]